MNNDRIRSVLEAAHQRLQTARFGLEDMKRAERFNAGLFNAVVFGRMVTFALQNLRGLTPEFDAWYAPRQSAMRDDPLMRYFSELRTDIEKRTNMHTSMSAHIRGFTNEVVDRFRPAPPGATAFFVGDQNGGSGWIVKRSDGTDDKYYVDMPKDIANINIYLATAPAEYRRVPAELLLAEYLDRLEKLIEEARLHFLS